MKPELIKLFPFVLRAKLLVVGRERLRRCRNRLQFVWITEDLSENSRREILADFAGVAIVQAGSCSEFEEWFGLRNTKVIGLRKSSLGVGILRHLEARSVRASEPRPDSSSPRGSGAKQRRRDRGKQDETRRSG